MKKLTLTAIIACTSSLAIAQSFQVIANDPAGDSFSGYLDAKSISVASSPSQDSTWLIFETHNARTNDYGYAIGIDGDNNPNNGAAWNGRTNNGFKWDIMLLITRNGIMQPTYTAYALKSDGSSLGALNVTVIDSKKFKLGVKRSLLSPDGKFKFVGGVGGFDIEMAQTMDDIPNTGVASYTGAATSVENLSPESLYRTFPNPVNDRIIIETGNSGIYHYQIRDLKGSVISEGFISAVTKEASISLQGLNMVRGYYLLVLQQTEGSTSTSRFFKQ